MSPGGHNFQSIIHIFVLAIFVEGGLVTISAKLFWNLLAISAEKLF